MTEAAPGIYIKSRLELRDYLDLDEILFKLDKSKSRVRRGLYLMSVVKILTTKSIVWPWDIKYLNAIFQAVGMLNPKANTSEGVKNSRRKITVMASDLGARLGRFQKEVIDNMTFEECELMSQNLLIERYERIQDMMSAKHPTKKAFTSISSAISNIKAQINKGFEPARIQGPTEHKIISKKAFSAMVSG